MEELMPDLIAWLADNGPLVAVAICGAALILVGVLAVFAALSAGESR
jgi:hypothetical protein